MGDLVLGKERLSNRIARRYVVWARQVTVVKDHHDNDQQQEAGLPVVEESHDPPDSHRRPWLHRVQGTGGLGGENQGCGQLSRNWWGGGQSPYPTLCEPTSRYIIHILGFPGHLQLALQLLHRLGHWELTGGRGILQVR